MSDLPNKPAKIKLTSTISLVLQANPLKSELATVWLWEISTIKL